MSEAPARRTYDHRIRLAVVESGNPDLYPELEIPDSTARSWIRRGRPQVIALRGREADLNRLERENLRLKRRVDKLQALVRLLVALSLALGGTLRNRRVKSGAAKARLLRALERSQDVLGRAACLRVLGLSVSRLRSWKNRALSCALEDQPSCPKSSPTQLTPDERHTMRDLIESPRWRHLSLRALALLAHRLGLVFASYGTWCAYKRRFGWGRPRTRVYPAKPREGIRAVEPDQLWHVDVTILRLTDRTRIYIHAIIDNVSRRILAWAVEPMLSGETTGDLFERARDGKPVRKRGDTELEVLTDGGSENLVLGEEGIARVATHLIAQVDVAFSNSIIEAFWRQLKHCWLYLHRLDSMTLVRRLVEEYVTDHNSVIPRVELGGRTPDEVYFGTEQDLTNKMISERADAHLRRVEVNRAISCGACDHEGLPTGVGGAP